MRFIIGIMFASLLVGCNVSSFQEDNIGMADSKEKSPEKVESKSPAKKQIVLSSEKEEAPAKEIVTVEDTVLKDTAGTEQAEEVEEVEDPSLIEVNPSDELSESVLVESEGVSLASIIIARGVSKRQPVEPGTSFPIIKGERIYAVLDVKNPEKTENQVSVSWVPVGGKRERGKVSVSVGAQKKWRTWAFTRAATKEGKWIAIIRNGEGEIIGRAPFEMTASVEQPAQ